jgi:hypothetical protein
VPEGGVTTLPGTCFAHAAIGNAPVRAPQPIPKRCRRGSRPLQLDDVPELLTDRITVQPASALVNSVRNDGPELLELA